MLGRQAMRAPMQKRRLTNARQAYHEHDEPRQPKAEATVWWTAVAEEIEIIRDRLAEPHLFRLTRQHVQPVLALRTRRDLHALPHQVEALRGRPILLVTHVVERP